MFVSPMTIGCKFLWLSRLFCKTRKNFLAETLENKIGGDDRLAAKIAQLLYKVKRWHESDRFVAKDANQYERE